jgi:hypothetical protein
MFFNMKQFQYLLLAAVAFLASVSVSAQRVQVVDKQGNGIPMAYVLTEDGTYIGSTDLDGVLADVKGAQRVSVSHVAYRPQMVSIESLTNGRIILDDLGYDIPEVVITPKPYVYVETYYRVYVYRNDSLGYFHCGIMPNIYDPVKKKRDHGSFNNSYVEYYSSMGVAINWGSRAMGLHAGEVRIASAPKPDDLKSRYYVSTDASNPDHVIYSNAEGRLGQLLHVGDEWRTSLNAGKMQMYANRVNGQSKVLKKREEIGYDYQYTQIGNYQADPTDADYTDFIMSVDHWEYTDKKGHAKFIFETYATERGYITKDEWKAKKKDLKAQYKKAYNLSDMEPYEKAHNIPPLPQAVRQAIAKLKH